MNERVVIDSSYLLEAVVPTSREWQAMYLMLAKRMGGLPIATRDKGMQAGARALCLPLYTH
ncbi:MAG: hypothetical protein ACT4NV_13755 [Rhodoferax sp.]